MTRVRVALTAIALAAALAGGCAAVPEGGAGAAVARPLSDLSPANAAESRARIHVDLGMAYFEVGRYDVALDEARVALGDSPGYAPAFHLLGLAYMLVGETAAAQQNFEQALRAAPGDPEFNNSYGWFLCTQGREQEGLARLAQAARNPYYRHPTRPHTNAGLCHLRLGDDASAEAQFLRAAQADPANRVALHQLAEIAYRGGRYEQARAHLVRLHQQLGPSAASAWLGLRTERRLGNHDSEASYAAQLRSRFAGSDEYQLMMQGKYE
jgi:type IV pilus assembly protein PilF